ncbi:GDSL-like Lipase/Acylhydrolase [bacterium BMS3Abin03]|nr:GDSL-like Lipase/Acylhydrolase [bacterium BMS3Abin03]HDZ58662.1 hypothetical protein [Ignavibacteriales bacterium]
MHQNKSKIKRNTDSKTSKSKQQVKSAPKWFYGVLIAIPIVLIIIIEIFLRVVNYGYDFTEFKLVSDYYPDKLFLNPDLPNKYFINLKNTQSTLPDGFDKVKKENAFRIFVIGGSTTAGWPYVLNASFSRHLKRRLELLYPKTPIEVINCGISAINSYTLLDFIPGILGQKPDLVLIYAGHNEYYGALGAGSSVSLGNSRTLVNTYLWLKDFRITQLLEDAITGIYGMFKSDDSVNDETKNETLMAKMIGESLIPLCSEIYKDGIEQFEGNLNDILEMLTDAGVPVLLGDLTCNTLDLKPFVSVKTDSLPPAEDIFEEAKQELSKGKIQDADSLFLYAKELDALRFRAPQKMNEIINELAKKYNISVVNIDSLFRSKSKYGIVGYNLIVDHLHPNIDGYTLIGKAYYERMEQLNYLPAGKKKNLTIEEQDSILKANFPFTRLDSVIAEMKIIKLTGAYPFVPRGTPNYKIINYPIRDLVDSLGVQVINKDVKWETAHSQLANKYYAEANYKGFINEMNAIISERPYFDEPYEYLIAKIVDKGMIDEAIPYLQKLHRFKPSYFTTKWLGQIYLSKNINDKALMYLKSAAKFSQADSQTWYNLAGAYFNNDEIDNAIIAVKKSLELNPKNKLARKFYDQLKSLKR